MAGLEKERREQYNRKVEEDFPDRLSIGDFTKKLSLRYGQNPGSSAAFYSEAGATGAMADFEILKSGKNGLGFINVADMDLGQRVVRTLHDLHNTEGLVACCIVKHEIPSGVAMGTESYNIFVNAYDSDPLSNFGGVHVFSGQVSEKLAELLIEKERNAEVVYAPSFTPEALEILSKRNSLRVVKMPDINAVSIDNGLEYKRVEGGMLVERRQKLRTLTPNDIEIVSERKPSDQEVSAALFNWTVAFYTRSNAVVIGTEYKTHGIGSGQRSRIDAAEQAIYFANGRNGKNKGHGSKGTFMASDAFMPATDVVEIAANAGATGIIYPLGSVKDQEVIDVANKKGLSMIATRKPGTQDCERVFLHR